MSCVLARAALVVLRNAASMALPKHTVVSVSAAATESAEMPRVAVSSLVCSCINRRQPAFCCTAAWCSTPAAQRHLRCLDPAERRGQRRSVRPSEGTTGTRLPHSGIISGHSTTFGIGSGASSDCNRVGARRRRTALTAGPVRRLTTWVAVSPRSRGCLAAVSQPCSPLC